DFPHTVSGHPRRADSLDQLLVGLGRRHVGTRRRQRRTARPRHLRQPRPPHGPHDPQHRLRRRVRTGSRRPALFLYVLRGRLRVRHQRAVVLAVALGGRPEDAPASHLPHAMMRTIALVITLAAAPLLVQSTEYRIVHTYTLGGDGSWDYIVPDPPNHRLFIGRQNRVMVVDEANGTLLGEVTGIQGAHGTAIVEASGHGFATSGNDQSVVMFDLKTFKVLGRIPAAEDADAIIYDGPSNRVFTFNGDAHSSTVIDPLA